VDFVCPVPVRAASARASKIRPAEGSPRVDAPDATLREATGKTVGGAARSEGSNQMEGSAEYRLPSMSAGRHAAGGALLGWLDDEGAPRLCVVSGSAGVGKSHLLAWLHTASGAANAPARRRIHAFVPARDLTLHSVTAILAARLGLAATSPRALVRALARAPHRVVLGVADLDAAGVTGLPGEGARIVAELLDPLLELPHLRLLVESADPGTRAGFTRVPAPAVLDLDDPRWTDPIRFERWYSALLATSTSTSPFAAPDVYPHPGLARLAALVDGAHAPTLPPDSASGTLESRAMRVRQTWWVSVPREVKAAIASLSGLGTPLPLDRWVTAYRALDGAADPDPAASTARAARHLPTVFVGVEEWELPPGPLADFVAARRPETADGGRVLRVHDALRGIPDASPGSAADLRAAGEERISTILDHSVRMDDAVDLATDPIVQALARPHAVVSALVATRQWDVVLHAAFRGALPALIEETDPAVRAELLRMHQLGREEAAAAELAPYSGNQGWTAVWARWHDGGSSYPDRWPGPVAAAGTGRGELAGRVMLVDPTGVIRTIDAATGAISGRVGNTPPVPLRAVAGTSDGRLATLSLPGSLDVVDVAHAGSRGVLEATFEQLVNACPAEPTALVADPLAAIGDDAGNVWWHRSPSARDGVVAAALHTGPVAALAAVHLDPHTRVTLLVSGGLDGRVRLWSPGADPIADPLDARPSPVTAVAADRTERGPIIVVAWADGLVRVHRTDDDTSIDLRPGAPVHGIGITYAGPVVLGTAVGVMAIHLT
jgi:hypothetical protein